MNMDNGSFESTGVHDEIAIWLDGISVEVPPGHNSLNSIRCHLEMLALEKHRVLCTLNIDGCVANLTTPLPSLEKFSRIEAQSIELDENILLLLRTAQQQTQLVRDSVETAVTLVLINDSKVARELWWNLARQLKEPVLTLSLLPDHLCGPANGCASLRQLRKWQLEQIAAIIRDVDAACHTGNTIQISDALENHVLPWLQQMSELIQLWQETALAGARLGIKHGTY